MANVLDFFPKDTPYPGQVEALERIVEAFESGVSTILLEAPVGFGKSPLAITLARFYGGGHIITPRKALQDQYHDDFTSSTYLLKGQSSYPCFPAGSAEADFLRQADEPLKRGLNYFRAVESLRRGSTPAFGGLSRANAPCLKPSHKAFKDACKDCRTCPYDVAMAALSTRPIIVSNLHSFIVNAYFNDNIGERPFMAVDEAHEMRSILRSFITKTVHLPALVREERIEIPDSDDIQEFMEFFLEERFVSRFEEGTPREEYVATMDDLGSTSLKNFLVDWEEDHYLGSTRFSFIPRNLGNSAYRYLLDFAPRRVLMSGTIYDKEYFCRVNGLSPDEVQFIRMPSTFAPVSKPVHMKPYHMTDNSFKSFEDSYPRMLDNIRHAMSVFSDVRGLIHAPSYAVAERMFRDLADPRLLFHTPENFKEVYHYFLNESDSNAVLISPICQQGVDLKYDRARFQLIVRVPYPNANDVFMKDLMERDFRAYNYEALVVFGQMLGRPVRAPDDWGHTILLDSRFPKFISSNRSMLPSDVLLSLKTS